MKINIFELLSTRVITKYEMLINTETKRYFCLSKQKFNFTDNVFLDGIWEDRRFKKIILISLFYFYILV